MLQTAWQDIDLHVPQSEVGFITTLAQKMGWEITTKTDLLQKYIHSRPKNVDLPDKEIMEEVRSIRYAK
jgi:hypothetical protein